MLREGIEQMRLEGLVNGDEDCGGPAKEGNERRPLKAVGFLLDYQASCIKKQSTRIDRRTDNAYVTFSPSKQRVVMLETQFT